MINITSDKRQSYYQCAN